MNISISTHTRHSWRSLLRSWLIRYRALFLLLAGWLIWTKPCRELLESASQGLTAKYSNQIFPVRKLFQTHLSTIFYARSSFRSRRLDLLFWMWLATMLSLHLRLVSAPASWQVVQIQGSSIPWFTAAHLIFTVIICLSVIANTLEPGQSRIPLQKPRVESRPLHDVVLVSSTAFGPSWLRQHLKRWFPQLPIFLNREVRWLVRAAQGYHHFMMHRHLAFKLLKIVFFGLLTLLLLRLKEIIPQWYAHGVMRIALPLYWFANELSKDMHSRLPSFEQLWLHQALKIDGRYYELTWVHLFGDSTELSDSVVEEDKSYAQGVDNADGNPTPKRTILSERYIGQTYMTKEEILRTGNELIKTSPGYDLFSYNCTWFRHNLFLRIKYDGPGEQNNPYLLRNSLASELPYYGFLSLVVNYIYYFSPFCIGSSSFWQTIVSNYFWPIFELIMLSISVRALVVSSSTNLGRVCRSRMIVPIAIGTILLQHAYQHLNDGRLFYPYSQLYGDSKSVTTALMNYTLLPTTMAFMLAEGGLVLIWDLEYSQERFEVVTDDNDHDNGIHHPHHPPAETGPTGAAVTPHVTLRIKSDYGERLPGETSKHGMINLRELFRPVGQDHILRDILPWHIHFWFMTCTLLMVTGFRE